MKKLLFLSLMLITLVSCEQKRNWKVETTNITEQWNAREYRIIWTKVNVSSEVVLDMSEKEIKDYCRSSFHQEEIGIYIYKYYTNKKYTEQ